MSETLNHRFTPEEMAKIRASMRDEMRLGRDLLALLRRLAARIPFAEDALAAWYCTRDPTTPRRVRLTLLAALAYLVLPIDAIPDILPIIGFTDDAAVVAAAIAAVAGSITADHRQTARERLKAFSRAA
jgi:uncharacterized membrane protein YkvA (DUF1232 family)